MSEDVLAAARRGEWREEWWQQVARTVAVDFDGTLHPYSKGWTGSEPDDEPPIPGASDFLHDLLIAGYDIVIFSTRADHPEGKDGIIRWIGEHMRSIFYAMRDDGRVRVTHEKPAAIAYVDDRAVVLRHPNTPDGWADVWRDVYADVEALAAGRPHGAGQAPPADPPPAEHPDHPHGSVVEQVHRIFTSDQGLDSWALAEEVVRFVEARAAGIVRGA